MMYLDFGFDYVFRELATLESWRLLGGFKSKEIEKEYKQWFYKKHVVHFQRASKLALLLVVGSIAFWQARVPGGSDILTLVGDGVQLLIVAFVVVVHWKFPSFAEKHDVHILSTIVVLVGTSIRNYAVIDHFRCNFSTLESCVASIECTPLEVMLSGPDAGLLSGVEPNMWALLQHLIWSRYNQAQFTHGFLVILFGIGIFVGPFCHAIIMVCIWLGVNHFMIFYAGGDHMGSIAIWEVALGACGLATLFMSYMMESGLRETFVLQRQLLSHNHFLERDLRTARRMAAFQEPTVKERGAVEEAFDRIPGLRRLEVPFRDLTLLERVGQGAVGEVIRADHNGTEVAVKRVLRGKLNKKTLDMICCEVKLMCRLRHRNIITFIGASWDNPANVCVVMEFASRGSLTDMLLAPGAESLTWLDPKLGFALDIVSAMIYLHSRKRPVIHRDLKADNVLVSAFFVCKLTDFGLSREVIDLTMISGVGTPLWLAPEVIKGQRYTEMADVYSFSMLMVELATRAIPYSAELQTQETLAQRVIILVAAGEIRPQLPVGTPPQLRHLLADCWAQEPSWRPDFKQVEERLRTALASIHDDPVRARNVFGSDLTDTLVGVEGSDMEFDKPDPSSTTRSGNSGASSSQPTRRRNSVSSIFCDIDAYPDGKSGNGAAAAGFGDDVENKKTSFRSDQWRVQSEAEFSLSTSTSDLVELRHSHPKRTLSMSPKELLRSCISGSGGGLGDSDGGGVVASRYRIQSNLQQKFQPYYQPVPVHDSRSNSKS